MCPASNHDRLRSRTATEKAVYSG